MSVGLCVKRTRLVKGEFCPQGRRNQNGIVTLRLWFKMPPCCLTDLGKRLSCVKTSGIGHIRKASSVTDDRTTTSASLMLFRMTPWTSLSRAEHQRGGGMQQASSDTRRCFVQSALLIVTHETVLFIYFYFIYLLIYFIYVENQRGLNPGVCGTILIFYQTDMTRVTKRESSADWILFEHEVSTFIDTLQIYRLSLWSKRFAHSGMRDFCVHSCFHCIVMRRTPCHSNRFTQSSRAHWPLEHPWDLHADISYL